MKIIDAAWTPGVNILIVECVCGESFEHPTNRWAVRCPECGKTDNLKNLRERYAQEGKDGNQSSLRGS